MPRYDECSIYSEACRNRTCDHVNRLQRIWRNISNPSATGCGYFVTEVVERADDIFYGSMMPTKDGSYIVVGRYFFETKEGLQKWLAESWPGELMITIQPRKGDAK